MEEFFQDNPHLPRISKDEVKRYQDWAQERLYLTSPDKGVVPNVGLAAREVQGADVYLWCRYICNRCV